jgi:DNA-binding MarR family transcriptional regulator
MGPLQRPGDLDLLLFFHRFPRVLLTSEKLAEYIGYDVKQIGTSLERLIHAQLISRSQNPTHKARLYVFIADRTQPWLAEVLSAASTHEGRSRLLTILRQREVVAKAERTRTRGGSGSSGSSREDLQTIHG